MRSLIKRISGWQPYDPRWLITLANQQCPEEPWLAPALARCLWAQGVGSPYIRFVSSVRPNAPGSAWQFERNIVMEHPRIGEIVVDVLKTQRVGGIELLGQLLGRCTPAEVYAASRQGHE
jgi:hypothetical protein